MFGAITVKVMCPREEYLDKVATSSTIFDIGKQQYHKFFSLVEARKQ